MKATRLNAYGDIDQFSYGDAPDPVAGAGEVLVKIEASGLNPVDLYVRQGYMAERAPLEFPAIIGLDGAGTIAAIGGGVSGYAVGDRVIVKRPIGSTGTHAELVATTVDRVAKLPANVSFEAGATLPLVGLTGRQAVDALNVKAGERVAVAAALGGVGRAAVQYLKELGAVPVAVVRAEDLEAGKWLTGEVLAIGDSSRDRSFAKAIAAAGRWRQRRLPWSATAACWRRSPGCPMGPMPTAGSPSTGSGRSTQPISCSSWPMRRGAASSAFRWRTRSNSASWARRTGCWRPAGWAARSSSFRKSRADGCGTDCSASNMTFRGRPPPIK